MLLSGLYPGNQHYLHTVCTVHTAIIQDTCSGHLETLSIRDTPLCTYLFRRCFFTRVTFQQRTRQTYSQFVWPSSSQQTFYICTVVTRGFNTSSDTLPMSTPQLVSPLLGPQTCLSCVSLQFCGTVVPHSALWERQAERVQPSD